MLILLDRLSAYLDFFIMLIFIAPIVFTFVDDITIGIELIAGEGANSRECVEDVGTFRFRRPPFADSGFANSTPT